MNRPHLKSRPDKSGRYKGVAGIVGAVALATRRGGRPYIGGAPAFAGSVVGAGLGLPGFV